MWILYILPTIICILYMIGGQINKGARRFGVPGIALSLGLLRLATDKKKENNKEWPKYLIWATLVGLLSIGYGVDSFFKKIFKKELTIRLAYGMMLSLPFGAFLLATHQPMYKFPICMLVLCGAYSVHAGSLGKIGKYDILMEDILRGFTLGSCMTYVMMGV